MKDTERHFKRDLFEIENARNMTRDELVSTFQPTRAFWRLLSAKHHIVLGARGSGKTALTKMLSHNHLSKFNDERAAAAIKSQSFVGIYVATRVDWIAGLRNKPWQSAEESATTFRWRLNLACCSSLIVSLKSCIQNYIHDDVDQLRVDAQLATALSEAWGTGKHAEDTPSLKGLQFALDDLEADKLKESLVNRVTGNTTDLSTRQIGIIFEADLFYPLRRGIQIASRSLELRDDCAWLLCLDEAEFLDADQQRMINTHMRGAPDNLFFKVTTIPYLHRTLETDTPVPLNVGHDFEYVYVDQDPVITAGQQWNEGLRFAETLFFKRAQISGSRYKGFILKDFLGYSPLLDRKDSDWEESGKAWALLRKYGSPETIARAEKLRASTIFGDQVARKIHPALLLREELDRTVGRAEISVFCGERFVVRCGDANPRRLIRIFNSFLIARTPKRIEYDGKLRARTLDSREQSRNMIKFATGLLSRIQSEPKIGPQLHELLNAIGKGLSDLFVNEPITTDQVYSIKVELPRDEEYWELIKVAVGVGLLYPNTSANNPDELPLRGGTFHLAYALAPAFRLIPRRGKSRAIASLVGERARPQQASDRQGQLPL